MKIAAPSPLRESEQRLVMAGDAANLGIWTRDLVRDEIWATEKWRELFGFTMTETLDFNRFLERLHPDDRHALSDAGRPEHGAERRDYTGIGGVLVRMWERPQRRHRPCVERVSSLFHVLFILEKRAGNSFYGSHLPQTNQPLGQPPLQNTGSFFPRDQLCKNQIDFLGAGVYEHLRRDYGNSSDIQHDSTTARQHDSTTL